MAIVYPYGLYQILIAAYNATADTYSTPVDLEADQKFDVDPQADTDQMRDSGQITRTLAVYTHANVTIGKGGISYEALGVLAGAYYGADYAYVRSGGSGLPYFGAMGVVPTDDGKIIVAGLRAIKLDKPPQYTFDGTANTFVVNETSGVAIAVSRMVDKLKEYANEAAWLAAKPTDGTGFKSWFS